MQWRKRFGAKGNWTMTPRTYRVTVDAGVTLAVREWGHEANQRVAVCAHGLTRNGHDFDRLAEALADRYRVVTFDAVGRGDSDLLADPSGYAYPTYVRHGLALLAHLGVPTVDWIGTSMGGILGMLLAAHVPQQIGRLVLNDVGPLIPRVALTRILTALESLPSFLDEAEALAHFRLRYASFGPIDEAGWRHLVRYGTRRGDDGQLHLAFDPRLVAALVGSDKADVVMWDLWAGVRQPVLLLRGAESDLLLRCTAKGMVARGDVTLVEFPDTGHAPSLLIPEQIAVVTAWLDRKCP